MSEPQKKKGLSPELRLLLAFLLSLGAMSLWMHYFVPKPPARQPAATGTAKPAAPATPPAQTPAAQAAPASAAPAGPAAAAAAAVPVKADTQERTFVVESDLYRVEFTNRGAVVRSWQLKKYTDDAKPRRTLDLVHADAARQTGGWPFSLMLDDATDETTVNNALYQVEQGPTDAQGHTTLRFSWSDGHLEVSKVFTFDGSYVVQVEASVRHAGAPIVSGLAWRGGFGDVTVQNPAPAEQVNVIFDTAGKLQNLPHKKLNAPDQTPRAFWYRGMLYAGIEDRYFAAVFLAPLDAAPGNLATRYWKLEREVKKGEQTEQEPVAEVAVGTGDAGPFALRVFVGPKDYDALKKMNPPLHALVQFGWMEFIADPLFHLLKWLHTYIPNWGWAIIVLTLVINMLLFPLRISSYRTALKMQRIGPEVKQIQERYKKYKMNDPKKAEMNQEIMAIYSREGINPMGGCFQMLLQMPIWFGLNTALRYSIELRHATWVWVTDLSAKDPYYILPVTVGLSMYLVSKMTPMTSTDPNQEMMMKIMPVSMAVMFVVFPFSSGLALYILTSSVVGIGQQWYLNKTHPASAIVPVKPGRGKKA
ncbi:MAG: membrane protein insertase YidC [Acidobacteriia bacterium]|nr:membrane protein insertase YidC [Terriglobia bacterium]